MFSASPTTMCLNTMLLFLPVVLGPGVPRATAAPPMNQPTAESSLAPDAIPIVRPVEFNRYLKAVNFLQVDIAGSEC